MTSDKSTSECCGVNHPAHYNRGKIEVITAILDWDSSFCLGNAIKYIARCNYKGDKVADLRKAIWYIEREISESVKMNMPTETPTHTSHSGKLTSMAGISRECGEGSKVELDYPSHPKERPWI